MGRPKKYHTEKARKAARAEGSRKWRKANRDKLNDQAREKRKQDPEQQRERQRRGYAANPEHYREKSRKWCRDNPEAAREIERGKVARKANRSIIETITQLGNLYAREEVPHRRGKKGGSKRESEEVETR
jgi:hypothetical protein